MNLQSGQGLAEGRISDLCGASWGGLTGAGGPTSGWLTRMAGTLVQAVGWELNQDGGPGP